ncbi:MAG: hypothetical protein Q8936_23960 [Bacillota bacterium]|nr:hypothetical protein [Bacillota bacterium]
MSIGKEIFERINRIDWFCNCGSNPYVENSFEVKFVHSWEDAVNNYSQSLWEDTTLEARNELTSFLNNKYRQEYAKWNEVTKEAKSFLEKNVVPKINIIKEKYNLDDVFTDCVKWDLLGAIMEYSYKECKNRPTFFLEILSIYELGHFPCGWEGEWPKGKLVIF